MLARGQLTFFQWQAEADASKAQRELGFTPTALEDGPRRALEAMGLLFSLVAGPRGGSEIAILTGVTREKEGLDE